MIHHHMIIILGRANQMQIVLKFAATMVTAIARASVSNSPPKLTYCVTAYAERKKKQKSI